jgi:uncharacterized protein (DUF433 family)
MSHATQKARCDPHYGFPPNWRSPDRPWFRDKDLGGKDFDVPLSKVFEQAVQGRPSIAIDDNVLGGTPHISGTRIPVFMVLDAVEYYGTLQGALESYPGLTLEQVKDAVSFAAAVTEHPVDYEVESSTR